MVATGRKVVAHFADGRLVKGYTFDFTRSAARFNVFAGPAASGPPTRVLVRDLKAVFFVRDLAGDPARRDDKGASPPPGAGAPVVRVRFRDGEEMVGTVEAEAPDGSGVLLVPADSGSNNLRVFVVRAATVSVRPVTPERARPAEPSARARPPTPSGLSRRLFDWLRR